MAGNPGGGWGNGPFGPPGGGQPPGGFGQPPGGFGQPPGGFGQPPGGFGQPPGGFGQPPGYPPQPNFSQPGYPPPGFNQVPPQPSSKKGLLIGVGVVLILGACGAAIAVGAAMRKKEQQTYGALKDVCAGRGVASARMYNPASPPHKVVGISRSAPAAEWDVRMSLIPSARRATGVSDADIVMCFEPVVEQTLGTCDVWTTRNGIRVPGTTRNYPRVQMFQPVRLVSAQTGVTLQQGTLVGPEPTRCTVTYGRSSVSTFRGSNPGADQVELYLAPLLR